MNPDFARPAAFPDGTPISDWFFDTKPWLAGEGKEYRLQDHGVIPEEDAVSHDPL